MARWQSAGDGSATRVTTTYAEGGVEDAGGLCGPIRRRWARKERERRRGREREGEEELGFGPVSSFFFFLLFSFSRKLER